MAITMRSALSDIREAHSRATQGISGRRREAPGNGSEATIGGRSKTGMEKPKAMNIGAFAANIVNLEDRKVRATPSKKADTTKVHRDARNYAVLPIRAIKDKSINTKAAFLVLAHMCAYTNRHGETWVSQQTVAEGLGVTRQAVAKQLKLLMEAGYLECLQRGGKHFSTRWRVVFDPSLTIEEVKANTPASLREDDKIEAKPLSKEEAKGRLEQLKNAIKGRNSTQPHKVALTDDLNATSEVASNQFLMQPNGVLNATKRGVQGNLHEGCTNEERSITNGEPWFEE